MVVISKGEDWPDGFYPKVENPQGDTLSKYTLITKYEDGYILFHTITWSLYFLTEEDRENALDNDILKRYHVVLDSSINEDEIAEKVYLERSELPKSVYRKGSLNSFVIFTTTACNARCAYCYEQGIRHVGMTLGTAEKVVQYILKKANRKKEISIRWFGGEPLLNTKVMDYISTRLKEENVNYTSDIITNGLLFDDSAIEKIPLWKLRKAQITIDGIGEGYNKIKDYKNPKADPFATIISNIHKITEKSDVSISIRINISKENIDDVMNIVKTLRDEFEDERAKRKVHIYAREIYQMTQDSSEGARTEDYKKKVAELYNKYPDTYGGDMVLRKRKMIHCGADRGAFDSIDPRGRICPCEHWSDDEIIGDVENGITNWDVAERWRVKSGENIRFCKEAQCPLLPVCEHFIMCNPFPGCHTEWKMKESMEDYAQKMAYTYEYYKKKMKNKQ